MKYLVKASTIVIGLLCFCSMDDSISNNITIYENDAITYWQNKNENLFLQYVEKWYEVLPEHPVTIILVGYETPESLPIQCQCLLCNVYPVERMSDTEKPTIKIPSRFISSGTWYCSLYDTKKKSNQHIYFRLRVKSTIPSQQILVNHINLNVENEKDIYIAEYFYQEGETVNVDCINSDDRCTVQMSNSFSATVDDKYEVSVWGIGFPIKLNSYHNGKKIHCISYCSGNKTTVEVKFVLPKELDNTINVKINDQDVTKNMAPSKEEDRTYNINYAYFLNHRVVTITCDTNRQSIDIDLSCTNCNITERGQNKVILIPNIMSIVSCKAKSKNVNEEFIENVVVSFQLITCQDNSQLTLQGLRRNNILSESYVYEYRQGISYINYTYQYENNENLLVNCSINLQDGSNTQNQFISFNNSAREPGINNYIKYMTPNLENKNEQVSCDLHDLKNNKTIAQIWVLFRFKNRPAISSSSVLPNVPKVSTVVPNMNVPLIDDDSEHNDHDSHKDQTDNDSHNDQTNNDDFNQHTLWIPAVIVPILVIVVCTFTVIYKMKKRNRLNMREPENTYDYCTTNAITEIEYAVPEGEMRENTLYQRTKDFYAKVIPKSQRQCSKQQGIYTAPNESKEFEEGTGSEYSVPNSLYSSPCLKRDDRSDPTKDSGKASSNLEMSKDVYSEPIDKKETREDTYTNVIGEPHYSNKIGGYCVYPTYSEPHIKH